jgi:hypothetical protein
MPKRVTSRVLVERATKCLATAFGSPASARSQSRAERALVRVSWVVKVFEATRNSVVSGRSGLRVSTRWVASTLETK